MESVFSQPLPGGVPYTQSQGAVTDIMRTRDPSTQEIRSDGLFACPRSQRKWPCSRWGSLRGGTQAPGAGLSGDSCGCWKWGLVAPRAGALQISRVLSPERASYGETRSLAGHSAAVQTLPRVSAHLTSPTPAAPRALVGVPAAPWVALQWWELTGSDTRPR